MSGRAFPCRDCKSDKRESTRGRSPGVEGSRQASTAGEGKILSALADRHASARSLDWRATDVKHSRGLPIITSKTYPTRLHACERHASDEVFSYLRSLDEETHMTDAPRTTSDAPQNPPRQKEDPRHPKPEDWREPGGDVREPPLPGTAGKEEKFPRKGEV
jgi:hypothetical protein